MFLYPSYTKIEPLFINKWRHSCVDMQRLSRPYPVCACVYTCMWTDRWVCLVVIEWYEPVAPWGSEVWLLWKQASGQGLIIRMCRESFSWELTSIVHPLCLFLSRICLCCWTCSELLALTLATSSPTQHRGSPDCRTLVNDPIFYYYCAGMCRSFYTVEGVPQTSINQPRVTVITTY